MIVYENKLNRPVSKPVYATEAKVNYSLSFFIKAFQ